MKTDKYIDTATLDKIINTAYGDASVFDKIVIFIKMISNKKIKKIYSDYRRIAREVHSIKPENIELKKLSDKINKKENVLTKFIYLFNFKPINISYASIILVLGVSIMFFLIDKSNDINYTQAQLSKAEQEFKYTLAIVGKTFNETERKLNEDIVNNKIRKPIKIGFQTINKLYK